MRLPGFGDKPVSQVTSHDVITILEPIWTSKPETSRKVRNGISKVMKWAMAQGYRSDNPAVDVITQALPKHGRAQHYQALPFSAIGAAIEKVRGTDAWAATNITLDRVHAAMLLQASGQSQALRNLLRAEQERGPDFLRLANALTALYPRDSEEKRLLDAMLLAAPR